jgi:hypothetical protein
MRAITFGDSELIAIRHLILQTASPDDSALSAISERDPKSLRTVIRRHLPVLLDPSVPLDRLRSLFNQAPAPSRHPDVALPPKVRDKARHSPRRPPQILAIPTLPRYEHTPSGGGRLHRPDPAIGSLVAVIHPDRDPCVCRVIACHPTHRTFLVVGFQAGASSYWVPSDYLFDFNSVPCFPLLDDEAFARAMESEISVDWLLERILSAAQHLVITNGELLAAVRPGALPFTPGPGQVQRIVMQCVWCAALLIFCRVALEWEFPAQKRQQVLATILRCVSPKFASTAAIAANVEASVRVLSVTALPT